MAQFLQMTYGANIIIALFLLHLCFIKQAIGTPGVEQPMENKFSSVQTKDAIKEQHYHHSHQMIRPRQRFWSEVLTTVSKRMAKPNPWSRPAAPNSKDTVIALRLGAKQHRYPVASKLLALGSRSPKTPVRHAQVKIVAPASQTMIVKDPRISTTQSTNPAKPRVAPPAKPRLQAAAVRMPVKSDKNKAIMDSYQDHVPATPIVVGPLRHLGSLALIAAIARQTAAAAKLESKLRYSSLPEQDDRNNDDLKDTVTHSGDDATRVTMMTSSETTVDYSSSSEEPDVDRMVRTSTEMPSSSTAETTTVSYSTVSTTISDLGDELVQQSESTTTTGPAGLLRNIPWLRSKVMEAVDMRRRKMSAVAINTKLATGNAIIPFPRI